MSAAEDLQALVASLKGELTGTKTSLDAIKTGVAAIVAGLPVGGMTAAEVADLKATLTDTVSQGADVQQAAADDAAAVAAAQPATPVTPPPATGTPTV